MKKIIIHIARFIGIYILGFFASPFLDASPDTIPNVYFDEFYWLEVLVATFLAYLAVTYFLEINPRKSYTIFPYCSIKKAILIGFILGFTILAWFIFGILLAVLPNGALKIVLFITWFLFIPVLCYFLVFRGIFIYKNKIRVFKIKIYTYNTSTIDNLVIDEIDNKLKIDIVVCGKSHCFFADKKIEQNTRKNLPNL